MRRAICCLGLLIAGCVQPAANRYETIGARSLHGIAVRGTDRRRVVIVVTNRRAERARVIVLRAGQAPALVGVAPPMSRVFIDVTGSAPVGSRVRFAALLDQGAQHVVTHEVQILRGGTVLLEIDAEGPRYRTATMRAYGDTGA